MRIIHFTYNTTGGAGKVAVQLHRLFLANGIESALINTETQNPSQAIYVIPQLSTPLRKFMNVIRYYSFRLYAKMRYKKQKSFAFNYNYNYRKLKFEEIRRSMPFSPDIIILHWIADFIMPEHIQELYAHFKCPIIWRYNDLAPITGGCHYPGNCNRYLTACGYCPAIGSSHFNDHAHRHWMQKKSMLETVPLIIINSTAETEKAFQVSPLFKTKRQLFIRNSLHTSVYNYHNREESRIKLKLKTTIKVVFWGATYIEEERKGFLYFVAALQELKKDFHDEMILLIAGKRRNEFKPDIPFPHVYTGLLNTEELLNHYKAADIVVVSSLEDGGPMMIVESMMCGTPVVSFATGLANELVITGETGYQAKKGNTKDLANGMRYVLTLQPEVLQQMQKNCAVRAATLYSEEAEMKRYRLLFDEILQ